MRTTHQRGRNEIRLFLLDFGNGRTKVGNVKREKAGLQRLTTGQFQIVLNPLGGDLAVVVVGCQNIGLLAPVLGRHCDQRLNRLCRRGAGANRVRIANTAFVTGVVEIQGLTAGKGLANGLARCRRYTAVYNIDLVVTH